MAKANLTDYHARMALDLISTPPGEADYFDSYQLATVNALRAITHGLLAVRNELALTNNLTWQARR